MYCSPFTLDHFSPFSDNYYLPISKINTVLLRQGLFFSCKSPCSLMLYPIKNNKFFTLLLVVLHILLGAGQLQKQNKCLNNWCFTNADT